MEKTNFEFLSLLKSSLKNEKLEDGLMNIEEWLDEKLVVLDKYKDSLNLNDD